MSESYAILPCNGLDKCAGCVSREVALRLRTQTDSEIICPVFYRAAAGKYAVLAAGRPLLVLDGCSTRCASKLAAEKNLKIAIKINLSEEAKKLGVEFPKGLILDEAAMDFVQSVVKNLVLKNLVKEEKEPEPPIPENAGFYPETLNYQTYKKDKFIFRVPDNEGFYFNENDVWAFVSGNRARVGVTDFVQKSLSDIMFFAPPAAGSEIAQFEEAGNIESGKAVFEIVSPVSGRITAVNESLNDQPGLINENPYEQGWILELELTDFENDRELLHDFESYFPVLKRKADEFHV